MHFSEPREQASSVGGPVDEIYLTLRIAGEDLDPQVTQLLGARPTTALSRGDRGGLQKVGVWLHATTASAGDLDGGIAALLGRFTSDLGAWARLRSLGRVDLYCGLHLHDWSRGTSLAPETMTALAARALTLEIDIYCSAEGSDA
jgi:hypothetical protein